MSGLPDKPVCNLRDAVFSETRRVGRTDSNCFCKCKNIFQGLLQLQVDIDILIISTFLIITVRSYCAVKLGTPEEGVEDELDQLCPLSQYKVLPTECDASSSEEDD